MSNVKENLSFVIDKGAFRGYNSREPAGSDRQNSLEEHIMKSRKTMDLTTGPIMSKLLPFVLPIMATNLLQHLYNAADKAVVGQFSGSGALAAVGASSPAITLIVNLFVGLSIATNIICSNLRGAKKEAELQRFMHTAVLTSSLVGLIVCLLGQLVTDPILKVLETPEGVMDKAALYMRLYFLGVPASLVYNFSSGILRAHGDTRRPMTIMSISGAINVALNLVFVMVFKMDVDGVALATAISQYVSAGSVLFVLLNPKGDYRLQMKKMRICLPDFVQIVKIGVPCSMNSVLFSLSNAIMQPFVNSLGETVLAGNVAANGIVGLIHQIMVAFYSSCISFAGQCYGAKKYRRIDRVMLTCMATCSAVLGVLCVVITVFPRPLIGLFNSDPVVITAGIPRLLICGWGYLLYGIADMLLGCLRGMKRSTVPMLLNVLSICAPRMIWIFLIYPMMAPGTANLFLCYPISYVITIGALGVYYIHCRKQLNRRGDEVPDVVTA